MRTLGSAWRVICENGRSSQSADTRREIEEFAGDHEARLTKIQRQLCRNAFTFSAAKGIEARKKSGGIRPLVVAPIESRIVQRAIHDVLLTVPSIRARAENPYSFGGVRKLKGKSRGAVPAALEAVISAVADGAYYVVRSDISSFFTRISKEAVTSIVREAVGDTAFVSLFSEAICVELENMASLRNCGLFPIHDIGVAQGNCLSPLLGNLLLSDFDREMNIGGGYCVRYIDDFLILARKRGSAEAQFARAKALLAQHGMQVNEKTDKSNAQRGFTFLGIDVVNGAIRPSRESRSRLLRNLDDVFQDGMSALRIYRKTGKIDSSRTVLRTLQEVRGIVFGWGRHYSFCNERNVFQQIDEAVSQMIRVYLGLYSDVLRSTDGSGKRRILGIPLLQELASQQPLLYPRGATPLPDADSPFGRGQWTMESPGLPVRDLIPS